MKTLKYLFCFFSLFLIFQSIKADDVYTPMLTEDAVWTQYVNSGFWAPNKNFNYQKLALRGTVEIEGVVYQKMYVTRDSPTFDACNAEYLFAMREEDRKIYVYIPPLEAEVLYLDFGLEVGDTSTILGAYGPWSSGAVLSLATVLEKDSILVGGEYRDRLKVDFLCWPEYWIEGVGGTMGLLREYEECFAADISVKQFSCHQINGVVDYGNTSCGSSSSVGFASQYEFDQMICLGQTAYVAFENENIWSSFDPVSGGILPYSFSVNPEIGVIEINENGMTVQPEMTTVYEVTVTDALGYEATKEITITVDSNESKAIVIERVGEEPGECYSENITLFTAVPYDNYYWAISDYYYGSGEIVSTEDSLVFGPDGLPAGNYSLTIEDENGCSETKVFNVPYFGTNGFKLFDPNPKIEYNGTNTTCDGAEVKFWTTESFFAYEWTLNDTIIGTSDTLTITSPFDAYNVGVCVFDENSCTDCSYNSFVSTSSNTPVISSMGDGLTTGEFNQYQWYFDGEAIPNTDVQSIVPLYEGTYTVGISDNTYGSISSCPSLSEPYFFESDLFSNFPLSVYVFLEGAYEPSTGLMNTNLHSNCLLPINQPYNVEPWFYEGEEAVCVPADFPNDAVDWVLVEMRTGTPNLINANTTVVERKAAMLRADGKVVDPENRPLTFENLVEGESYYIAIRHRNHLDVISSTPIIYGITSTYDFSTEVSMAFGPEQLKIVEDGTAVMYAGDYNPNGIILNTDYDAWFALTAANQVYLPTDGNLDGLILASDYDQWFINNSKIGVVEIRY